MKKKHVMCKKDKMRNINDFLEMIVNLRFEDDLKILNSLALGFKAIDLY